MLEWGRIKEDLYHGLWLIKRGMVTGAVESVREVDRMKLRYKLRAADQRLAESYRALGKYGLMRLKSKSPDLAKDPEWAKQIREVEKRQTEREKLAAEHTYLDLKDEAYKDDEENQSL